MGLDAISDNTISIDNRSLLVIKSSSYVMSTQLISQSVSIETISTTDAIWQKCLDTIPHDFYHLPGYLELEAKRHNATAEAIIIKDGESIFFLPYLIRNCCQIADSIEFDKAEIYDVISPYGYPGMLVSKAGENSCFIKKCWQSIHQHWQDRNICSAFIRLHPLLNDYIDPLVHGTDRFVVCDRGDVVICDLTQNLESIWQQMRKNHRTKINKLKRSGFQTKIVPIDKYLDVFIDIYQETMNRVHATSTYFFTRTYFEDLIAALGERLYLCIVELDGEIVAAMLITEFSGIVQYHLGGTRTNFLAQSPTTLAFDYIINWAKQRGNNYFNLGGGLGGSHDSLYHFKIGFSKMTRAFVTIRYIVDRDSYEYLTKVRAKYLQRTVLEIKSSSFFPAYRST